MVEILPYCEGGWPTPRSANDGSPNVGVMDHPLDKVVLITHALFYRSVQLSNLRFSAARARKLASTVVGKLLV